MLLLAKCTHLVHYDNAFVRKVYVSVKFLTNEYLYQFKYGQRLEMTR